MEEEMKSEEVKEEKKEEKAEKEKPLDKMTVKELREIAIGIPGLAGVHAMKKEELLGIIKEERGIVDEKPKKKIKALKSDLSIKDMKKKIITLRAVKGEAIKAKDHKKANVFRRRINRLKKQTRKVIHA